MNVDDNKFSHIKNMVFEGGGILGTAYVGALGELSNYINFNKVHHYAGTSAGAIIAAVLACRADINHIKKIMVNADFGKFTKITFSGIAINLPMTYGIVNGSAFESWFLSIIKDVSGLNNPSLKEIYELFGTTFTCAATNITTCQAEYFNTDTHPNMKLLTAVRASMSIPIMFEPVIIDNMMYIDGGQSDNFMIAKFDSRYTLGFSLKKSRKLVKINSMANYIHAVINTFVTGSADTLADVIKIHCGEKSPIDFDMSHDEINELVSCGKAAAEEFIKTKLNK